MRFYAPSGNRRRAPRGPLKFCARRCAHAPGGDPPDPPCPFSRLGRPPWGLSAPTPPRIFARGMVTGLLGVGGRRAAEAAARMCGTDWQGRPAVIHWGHGTGRDADDRRGMGAITFAVMATSIVYAALGCVFILPPPPFSFHPQNLLQSCPMALDVPRRHESLPHSSCKYPRGCGGRQPPGSVAFFTNRPDSTDADKNPENIQIEK